MFLYAAAVGYVLIPCSYTAPYNNNNNNNPVIAGRRGGLMVALECY